MALVETSGVWKEFPQPGETIVALQDINIRIERGEFIVITGESGSGKSTLLSLLGTLDCPTRGMIRLLDEDLRLLSPSRLDALRSRHIGFVFQDFRLVRHLSALDNIRLPLLFSGREYGTAHARALMDKFKMSHRARQRPDSLSRGEMQRIALARALINRPDILFADEPTANLDRANAEIIWNHLRELHVKEGMTIVAAAHSLDWAGGAGRVVRLEDGRIASDEKREDA